MFRQGRATHPAGMLYWAHQARGNSLAPSIPGGFGSLSSPNLLPTITGVDALYRMRLACEQWMAFSDYDKARWIAWLNTQSLYVGSQIIPAQIDTVNAACFR